MLQRKSSVLIQYILLLRRKVRSDKIEAATHLSTVGVDTHRITKRIKRKKRER